MMRRAVVALAGACTLASCGTGADEPATPDQNAVYSADGKRQSRLGSTVTATPAPTTTRQSSLVSIAQLRADLGAEETERGLRVSLPNDVLFDFDKADIKPDAGPTLEKLATLARSQAGEILVEGHSDAKGDDRYNLDLSRKRADAVAVALSGRGIAADRMRVSGLGETRPVAPNAGAGGQDDPDGRQKNRRVEVILPL